MGLIKAALSSAAGVLSDTWKDYFVCEALPDNLLMIKGTKKGNSGLFAKKDDVITNGSGIVVADGQCAIIVDDGVVVEVAAEPGNYTFDTSKSPSIFDGGFKGLKDTFSQMVERFTYGGETNRSQVVYYINTREIPGNMYGTATPVPFKVVDPSIHLNRQVMLKCNGEYSIQVTNPILFYKNVAGNTDSYYKEKLDSQMRSELLTALAPALAKLSTQGVSMYSDIPLHTFELAEDLNEVLSTKWSNLRGISIVSFGINGIVPRDEDLAAIQERQDSASLTNAQEVASYMAVTNARTARDAANNTAGAALGFMNMNMAQGNTASTISSLYAQQPQQAAPAQSAGGFCPYCGKPVVADAMFCSSCGKQLK